MLGTHMRISHTPASSNIHTSAAANESSASTRAQSTSKQHSAHYPEKCQIPSHIHGFSVVSCEKLPEIDGWAWVLKHDASGARMLYLQNDDNNKAFAIGFKTPPNNNTGVFHILEHSVLCGSKRYPVKEPFVDLLKTSMQTFLNAMTFPDKTLYPVASTNEKDLMNLMSVYLDAVFHPAIYQKKAIFEQEGWHYELKPNDPSCKENPATMPDKDTHLCANGVVYNEMKGALADASSILSVALLEGMFPDTCYRFESGGTPRDIPQLSYKEFLDNHAAHYQLANSYSIIYGNVHINDVLAFINDTYFTPVHDEECNQAQERASAKLPAYMPRSIEFQAPTIQRDIVRYGDITPDKSVIGGAFLIGKFSDHKRIIATEILLDALFGSNEAPLKRALLDAQVASEIDVSVVDAIAQPYAVVEAKGIGDLCPDEFYAQLTKHVCAVLDAGIDSALIEAALAHCEFIMRERNFGCADGVVYAMNVFNTWLYDDTLAYEYLKYEDIFKELHAQAHGSYFTTLARELFLENNHYALAIVKPGEESYGSDDAAFERTKCALSADEKMQLVKQEEQLRALQTQEDSAEDKARLPHLGTGDIESAHAEAPFEFIDDAPLPTIRHVLETHGITYVYRHFDACHLQFDDLPYLSILALIMGKLDTQRHSAAQIDTLVQHYLGNLSFYPAVHAQYVPEQDAHDKNATQNKQAERAKYTQGEQAHTSTAHPLTTPRIMFTVSASALEEFSPALTSLVNEVLLETKFEDTARIKAILEQKKLQMEQLFVESGHSCAMARCRSYYSQEGVVSEALGGVDYYRSLCKLLERFDNEKDQLVQRLYALTAQLFCDDNCTLSFAGSDEQYDAFWATQPQLNKHEYANPFVQSDSRHNVVACAQKRPIPTQRMTIPQPQIKQEAFIIPGNVCYASQGYDLRLLQLPYKGTWSVVSRALTLDYLWNEVRVKGGAYGVGLSVSAPGFMNYYSFRDPHLDQTLDHFKAAACWLQSYQANSEALEGFIVSSVASIDAPEKARQIICRHDALFFQNKPATIRARFRSEILDTTLEMLHSSARALTEITTHNATCTFTSSKLLENSKKHFDVHTLITPQN